MYSFVPHHMLILDTLSPYAVACERILEWQREFALALERAHKALCSIWLVSQNMHLVVVCSQHKPVQTARKSPAMRVVRMGVNCPSCNFP